MNRLDAVIGGMKMARELTLAESAEELGRLRAHVTALESQLNSKSPDATEGSTAVAADARDDLTPGEKSGIAPSPPETARSASAETARSGGGAGGEGPAGFKEAVTCSGCRGTGGNHEVFCRTLAAHLLRSLGGQGALAIKRACAPVVRQVADLEAKLAAAERDSKLLAAAHQDAMRGWDEARQINHAALFGIRMVHGALESTRAELARFAFEVVDLALAVEDEIQDARRSVENIHDNCPSNGEDCARCTVLGRAEAVMMGLQTRIAGLRPIG